MDDVTIGRALVGKRLERGLDKGRAAEMIGMSRTTYSSYEQDAQRPSVDVFPALAQFLGISMEDLLSLYGATCVAVIRSSLAKVMVSPGEGGESSTTTPRSTPVTSLEVAASNVEIEIQGDVASAGPRVAGDESSEMSDAPDLNGGGDVAPQQEGSQVSAILVSVPTESTAVVVPASKGSNKKPGDKKKKKKKKKNRLA